MSLKLKLGIWLKSHPFIANARTRIDKAVKEHKERMKKIREDAKRVCV